MLFAGHHVDAEVYNRVLFEQYRLLPMKIAGTAGAVGDKALTLDRQSADAHPFLRFREDEGYTGINRIEVRRRLVLEEPPKTKEPAAGAEEVRVLLRTNDGRPAIVSKKRLGEGEVLLFTTSVNDDQWTDWFIQPPFVPFVQVALNYLLEGQPQMFNRVAGEVLRWQPPRSGAEMAYDLVRPDGGRVRLGYPETIDGRPLVTANDLLHAGMYRIVRADGAPLDSDGNEVRGQRGEAQSTGVPFAVVPDLRESEDLESLTPSQLDERLGFKVVQLRAGDDGTLFSGAERLKREWTIWLLVGLLALTLVEPVLAWFCGRAW
jgi:hypothetical protein